MPLARARAPSQSEVAKLAFLRQLGAHEWDLSDLNPNRRKFLAKVGRRSTSQTLQRMPDRRLWARPARGHRIEPAFSRAASAARVVPIGRDQAGNPQPHDRSRHDARNLDSFLRTLGRKTSERRFRSARLHITSRKTGCVAGPCCMDHPEGCLIIVFFNTGDNLDAT